MKKICIKKIIFENDVIWPYTKHIGVCLRVSFVLLTVHQIIKTNRKILIRSDYYIRYTRSFFFVVFFSSLAR